MKQGCRSWSGCSDPGFSSLSSPALPLFQWCSGSWAEHHSLPSVVCVELSPPPGCLGCVPWDSSECDDFNMQLAESGRMSADWERILPRFYFGGLNRKHWTVCGCWVNHCGVTNVGTLPSGHLLSHRCSMCIFYLQEHGPVLLERGVKRKKKEWKYLRSHPLLWHFCWDNSSIPVSKALGYFHFHISRVDYCIFLNWFFTCPAQMGH